MSQVYLSCCSLLVPLLPLLSTVDCLLNLCRLAPPFSARESCNLLASSLICVVPEPTLSTLCRTRPPKLVFCAHLCTFQMRPEDSHLN